MSLNVRHLPLEHIAGDARSKRVFEAVESRLRAIEAILRDIIDTSQAQGKVRVLAPLIPESLAADPTAVSTFGRKGETRTFGDAQYVKTGAEATDTDWMKVASQSAIDNLIVIQATEPVASATSSLFWLDSSKTPFMLHVLTSFDGGTTYDYDASPFDFYSTTQPTASRTSPGRFVDISANPSVFRLKLQNSSGTWYYARQGAGGT